jgi:enamine deaminase RidA (YjgF/YER057c/UK114 family)
VNQRQHHDSGSTFEREIGYSRAVRDGEWVFVSGTTGFDYATMTIADDPVAQTRQAFRNIEAALGQAAGAPLGSIVRVHYYLPRAEDWKVIAPVLGEILGDIRPAATALVCDLIDPRMRIEVEATAFWAQGGWQSPA